MYVSVFLKFLDSFQSPYWKEIAKTVNLCLFLLTTQYSPASDPSSPRSITIPVSTSVSAGIPRDLQGSGPAFPEVSQSGYVASSLNEVVE